MITDVKEITKIIISQVKTRKMIANEIGIDYATLSKILNDHSPGKHVLNAINRWIEDNDLSYVKDVKTSRTTLEFQGEKHELK